MPTALNNTTLHYHLLFHPSLHLEVTPYLTLLFICPSLLLLLTKLPSYVAAPINLYHNLPSSPSSRTALIVPFWYRPQDALRQAQGHYQAAEEIQVWVVCKAHAVLMLPDYTPFT